MEVVGTEDAQRGSLCLNGLHHAATGVSSGNADSLYQGKPDVSCVIDMKEHGLHESYGPVSLHLSLNDTLTADQQTMERHGSGTRAFRCRDLRDGAEIPKQTTAAQQA